MLALSMGLSAGTLAGNGLTIDSVAIERHGAADFTRISNYFRRHGAKFRHGLYRSDPNREDGIYAIAFLDKALGDFNGNVSVSLEFIIAGDPKIHKIGGPLDGKRSSRELWIGITDEKWANLAARNVLAWRISLNDSSGEICTHESFLFPRKKAAAKKLATDAAADSK
jgi:hypothetical protein